MQMEDREEGKENERVGKEEGYEWEEEREGGRECVCVCVCVCDENLHYNGELQIHLSRVWSLSGFLQSPPDGPFVWTLSFFLRRHFHKYVIHIRYCTT